MNNILTFTKKMIGLSEEDKSFDIDLLNIINSNFLVLHTKGIGSNNVFYIDNNTTWDDYITKFPNLEQYIETIKNYIYLKTRLVFDPPTNSIILESIKQIISELEFYLFVEVSF